MTALSKVGQRRLAQFERIIEDGQATFVKVATALISIREEKLYRDDHATFDDYCRARWKFSASRARQLISASEIATDVAIDNEAQARELVSAPPEERAAIVEQAKAENDGKLTAPAIKKTRAKREKNAEGKACDSPQPGATGDSPPVEGGERPNSRVDHGAGLGDPAAPFAPPSVIDATSRETIDGEHLHECACGAIWTGPLIEKASA